MKWTPAFKEAFLGMIEEIPNITAVCRVMGTSTTTCRSHRESDPEFAARLAQALEDGIDGLEEVARKRAVDGWEEPVFYRGEVVGEITKYSDHLLTVLLKGNRPKKFNPRPGMDISTDGPVVMNFNLGGDGGDGN